MRHPVLAAVCLLILIQPVPSAAIGKITVDPNTPAKNAAQTADVDFQADARLNQKVTYQIKQGRLHSIANDLTRITGVGIFCGKSSSDWHVRDIPVTISAKDIELGKLLASIADVSHVALRSSNVDDGTLKYRFIRTPRMEKSLAEYDIVQNIRNRIQFDKEWEAAASLASQPERSGDDEDSMKFNNARAIGRLLSALGTGARDSMKTGDQVVLQPENVPEKAKPALLELVSTMRKRYESGYSFCGAYHPGSKATQEDMEQAEVILHTSENSNGIYPRICVNVSAQNEYGNVNIDSFQVDIKEILEPAIVMEAGDKAPDPLGGSDIGTKYTKVKWNDPNQEFLKMKVKLKAPDDMDGLPTLADVALALSDASGYTIVCEDFESQRVSSRASSFPQGEMTFQDVLRIFRWDVDWYADVDSKLIVAVSRRWVDAHKALVPESLIHQMKTKLEKDGVNLDDATPLTTLTDEQCNDWISGNRELASLTLASFDPVEPLWALYDSLDSDEKLMARSESGISLSVFKPAQLAAACKKCNAGLMIRDHNRAFREQHLLPADPDVLSKLKMRITSKENWIDYKLEVTGGGGYSWGGSSSPVSPSDTKPPQEGMLRKTAYTMQIFGDCDGKTYLINNNGPSGFPYYSLKWKKGEQGPVGIFDK